tara:strand:+ start:5770 stop:7419 length:1650 start_codon:yes stop_codon:yes gene_type:complete
MNLTTVPSLGVHRDSVLIADPVALEGASPVAGQTGLFIYTKSPVQVWTRSAAGAWSIAETLTGALGSRRSSVNWDDLTRIYVKSTSGSPATVRFVGQTVSISSSAGSAVSTWASLSDTPGAYSGQAGKYPKVKADETGIEFVVASGDGAPGPAGADGADGAAGAAGATGITGVAGADGADGTSTPAGLDKQLQFNNDGTIGAANIHYDAASVNVGIGTSTFNASMTNSLSILAGAKPTAGVPSQCTFTSARTTPVNSSTPILLLHCDDTTDAASNNPTFVLGAGGTLDTVSPKFGTKSINSDGINTGFTIDSLGNEFNFGLDDFTIEFWLNPDSSNISGSKGIFGTKNWYWGSPTADFSIFASGRVYWASSSVSMGLNFVANIWQHFVMQRKSGLVEFYLNGTLEGTTTEFSNLNLSNVLGWRAGNDFNNSYRWAGNLDEIMISSGTAKYTGNFVPESGPYSDIGATQDPAEMWVGDGSNNLTQISPHNTQGEWEFFSKNLETGRVVRVNMEKMVRRLEELNPGESFIEEYDLSKDSVIVGAVSFDPPE